MESTLVQTKGVSLQVFPHGNGPENVVLVHGYQASGRIWGMTQLALDSSHFRTVAISNRGAGDSDRSPNENDYTVEAFARDLLPIIHKLGMREITLVGHSMGGATVTQFALDNPDMVKGLVLLDPASLAGGDLPDGWEEKIREQFTSRKAPEPATVAASNDLDDFAVALRADMARNPLERLIAGRRSMAKLRLRERLKDLRIPVLIMGGDQDAVVGVDSILAEYLALPPDRRFLHVFHRIGHNPNMDSPTALASVVAEFVAETIPSATEVPVP